MKSHWIEYRGKRLLYGDLSNFSTSVADLKVEMEATNALIFKQSEKSVLMLVDLRGTLITPAVGELIRSQVSAVDRYIYKGAIVGLTGIRKTVFDLFSRFTRSPVASFEDVERAKDWLIRAN